MIPAKIVRTGGPSVELELSSLELFCFAPVLVESGFWCSVCKPIESSKQRNFLAAGSGSLNPRRTTRAARGGTAETAGGSRRGVRTARRSGRVEARWGKMAAMAPNGRRGGDWREKEAKTGAIE